MKSYGISKKLDCTYVEAVEKARAVLGAEGFGILTEIDVKATLKQKLDKDFRNYIILGACNPSYAIEALTSEIEIGLLMPCNVIVYENDDGSITVSAIDPTVAMTLSDNAKVCEVARKVKAKLVVAIDNL